MAAEPKIAILDYGMGNLRSVEKAFQKVGANAVVTADETEIASADGLVLPGVGAFPRAMERIGELGLDRMLHDAVGAEKPVLGICLGLQLLFQSSIEQGGSEGLGLLEGDVVQVPAGGRKVPHIGWAEVTWEKPDELTNGLRPGEPFYFVHSFVVQPTESELLGTASYGSRFACVAGKGKIWGVQFHPEKSSSAGLRMLTNFREICA
ncbi:MAG TPA: imidazole glycerol phosphate synthase subunit HisH [Solirubrobacterales bacterium]|nr:imidazole glycerol phosphate synthase subunit HisH [Solirubrobacterales bacterium]